MSTLGLTAVPRKGTNDFLNTLRWQIRDNPIPPITKGQATSVRRMVATEPDAADLTAMILGETA